MAPRRTLGLLLVAALLATRLFTAGSLAAVPAPVVTAVGCGGVTFGPNPSLANGVAGAPYAQSLFGVGGIAPYDFALTSGTLPTGVTLTSAGLISGVPGIAGISSFTVRVTDANGCTGSQDLALIVNSQPNSAGVNQVDAQLARTIRLSPVNTTDDSVSSTTMLPGNRGWIFSIYNHDAMSYTNPAMHIVSGLSGFPASTTITTPTLAGFGVTDDSNALRHHEESLTIPGSSTAGFDASRAISPLQIPQGGGVQTVTVSMKLVDPRYAGVSPNLNINVFGNCVAAGLPGNLDQGEQGSTTCTNGSGTGSINNAQQNKTYVFTFQIFVNNPNPGTLTYKPALSVQSTIHRVPGIVAGSSVSIDDNLLMGRADYSVDQFVEWHPVLDDTYLVDFPSASAQVNATTTVVQLVPGVQLTAGQQQAVNIAVIGVPNHPAAGTLAVTVDNNPPMQMPVWPNGPTPLALGALPAGSHTVTAVYGGDNFYTGSTGSLTFVVNAAPPPPPPPPPTPVTPPTFSQTLQAPAGACICTPLLMNYPSTGTQNWWMKAGDSLTLTAYAHAVNGTDAETVRARVFTSAGVQVGSDLIASFPINTPQDTEVGASATFATTAGAIYRVEVATPGTVSTQPHYRLRFDGAVSVGTSAPTAPSFEASHSGDPTYWLFNAAAGESIQMSLLTSANAPVVPGNMATHAVLAVFDLSAPGVPVPLVSQTGAPLGTTLTLNNGDGLTTGVNQTFKIAPAYAAAATTPRTYALSVIEVNGHYKLNRGAADSDRGVYLGWFSSGESPIQINIVGNAGPMVQMAVVNSITGEEIGNESMPVGTIDGEISTGRYRFTFTAPAGYAVSPASIDVEALCDQPITLTVYVYPVLAGNGFVIGDLNATLGGQVTFWGAQWQKLNALSGGAVNASFKGYANATSTNPAAIGGTWKSDPGNSSEPPSTIPTYIAVIVSSKITKSGSTIAGDVKMIAIVRTDAGYQGNPGHAGTGTIVALIR